MNLSTAPAIHTLAAIIPSWTIQCPTNPELGEKREQQCLSLLRLDNHMECWWGNSRKTHHKTDASPIETQDPPMHQAGRNHDIGLHTAYPNTYQNTQVLLLLPSHFIISLDLVK